MEFGGQSPQQLAGVDHRVSDELRGSQGDTQEEQGESREM